MPVPMVRAITFSSVVVFLGIDEVGRFFRAVDVKSGIFSLDGFDNRRAHIVFVSCRSADFSLPAPLGCLNLHRTFPYLQEEK